MRKLKTRYDDATDSLRSPSASMSGISSPNYMRDTTSSSARKAKFQAISDSTLSSSATILKSEKAWSVSGCSYSYCSVHGHQHQHHASSSPLKEFISARKMVNNRKDKKLREGAVHTTSVTKRDQHQSRQKVSIGTHKAQTLFFAREEQDTGLDFHVTTIAERMTECAVEGGDPSDNSAATPRKKSHPAVNIRNNLKHLKGRQKASNKDLQESHLEERGTKPANANENEDTVFESSQLSKELAIDRDSQDICECSTPTSAKEHTLRVRGEELQGDKSFNIKIVPSVATCTPDKRGDPTEVTCEDEQEIPTDKMEVLGKQLVAIQTSMPEGNHSAQSKTFMDKEKYTSLWDLHLQDVETDFVEKGEMQSSDRTDTEINTNNWSEFFPEKVHKGMDVQTPTSFEFHEDEVIKLIEEAINELLTLPEQARDNLFSSTCTNSKEVVWDVVVEKCREGSFLKEETKQVETSMNIFATLEDEKESSPRENLSNIYSKLSKVITCRRFIKALNKMRQLKLKSAQERQHTTDPEAEGTPSLHQTEIAEKKSWQEWMIDYALQQVVSKLAPAQRKRVALLVQAFEIVTSQPKPSTGQRGKAEMP